MKDMILKKWEKLEYHDPEFVLREFRKVEIKHAGLPVDKKVRNLRTNRLKTVREGREAALFCLGISKYMGTKVFFSPTELRDYDFVVCWQTGDTANYTAVQLKELVPEELNPVANVNDLIHRLKEKYPTSSDLIVAIHLNRTIRGLDLKNLNIPDLNLAGLYLFGATSEDQSQWALHGDFLGNPQSITFEYP